MPYVSKAQEMYFNIHKKELEHQGVNVDEWNSASKGRKLPRHVGNHSPAIVKRAKELTKK